MRGSAGTVIQIEQIRSLGTLSSCKATGGSGGGASMADVDSELVLWSGGLFYFREVWRGADNWDPSRSGTSFMSLDPRHLHKFMS